VIFDSKNGKFQACPLYPEGYAETCNGQTDDIGNRYLCFVAYPIVFVQHRGWSPGLSGLSFVGIGIGTTIAIACEPFLRRLINSHPRDPETGRATPEATASVMLMGAILTPIGQLVFSWTSLPTTIHWAIPIAFGIPFGAGNTLSFIYGANYLAGAYDIYAASALAGNAVMRSFFGGTLPLAGPAMYRALTPQWAGTLLGLLEVCLIPIPIIFWRYGARIRARSRVIRRMRDEKLRDEEKRARQAARAERRRNDKRAAVTAAAAAPFGERDEKEEEEEGVLQSRKVAEGHHMDSDVEKGPHVQSEKDETIV